ncbi:transposon Ty3-I Gag-Pol polyprotein [Nephila pilipes]|uniref:Transposon Ty3-I Gag-Pol polyprotein n=1 Tax=Nephila pilipes TaxID=299642 RepID=A0A8X6MRE0_NEPPI|nr:transposon Ty3-I Gag-Pol polyprotein [Nephila pilipes]
MTVTRLELPACLLLLQLVNKVIGALKLSIDSIQLFTDSLIALSWINTSPHLLKTFVCNRVVQIQELSIDFHWKHVSSKSNPADLLFRGLEAKALAASELWGKGPDFFRITLSDSQTLQTPSSSIDKLYSDEFKTPYKVTLKSNNNSNFLDTLIDITNNFHKLIRVLGFIFRFKSNCKSLIKSTGFLTQEEYQKAETHLLKSLQVKYFHVEIRALKKGSPVSTTSKLKFLNPFIDPSEGLIRVGGRITHAKVNFNQKFPNIDDYKLQNN